MMKFVIIAALVAATSAQICCNLQQECDSFGQVCDTSTNCYTDPRYMHLCRSDPYKKWTDDGWTRTGGWVFKQFAGPVNYDTAEIQCAGYGGTLAAHVLRDSNTPSHLYDGPWLGFKKVAGSWIWVDGGQMAPHTTDWKDGEPNNLGGIEDCGHIWSISGNMMYLNDASCDQFKTYVCEVKVI